MLSIVQGFYTPLFFILTLFRMGLLEAAHGWGCKKVPFSKICHTHPTIMKYESFILPK